MKTYLVVRASVLGVLLVLAAGCGPNHRTDQRNTRRVNNLGHHSSNEDEKMLGHQVSQFDAFASRLFGRYRGGSGELVLCNTVIDTYARALYLERSVGTNIVERRLFLADPARDPDSIQEHELLRAPPSVVCHGLPLQLSPEIVGKALRSWKMPSSRVDWEGPPGSFFVETTIEGQTIRYERALHGMVRVVAGEREEFRTLHRTQDGVWYVPEVTTPDENAQVEPTQASAACAEQPRLAQARRGEAPLPADAVGPQWLASDDAQDPPSPGR